MSKFAEIDTWLIEKVFEPVAHRVERETGVTNFTASQAVLVLWPASVGALALYHQSAIWWFLCAISLALAALRYLWVLWLSRQSRTTMNTDKQVSQVWRVMQTASVVFLTVPSTLFINGFGLAEMGPTAVWLSLYLSACDKPPPAEECAPWFARRVPT